MAEADDTSLSGERLLRAMKILRLSGDPESLTSKAVRDQSNWVEADLDEEIVRLRSTWRYSTSTRAEKLREWQKKVPKARDYILAWLEDHRPAVRQPAAVKSAAVKSRGEVLFTGLTGEEAEYAGRFYGEGVLQLRSGEAFYGSFCAGEYSGIDPSLVDALNLQDLTAAGRAVRLVQIGWPFPESADSQREFGGAVSVIEFLRGLVGEPNAHIPPLRRLLIEGSCLYADDLHSPWPTAVDIDDLEAYVKRHADGRFQDWDKLQIVLCYFLGVGRESAEASATGKSVMLYRLNENIEEIERKLGALNQDITRHGVAAVERTIRVELSANDLLNALLSDFTIADAVANGDPHMLPEDAVPYIKRQYDVLQGTPGEKHAYIGQCRKISSKTVKQGNRSCLERDLIHHRLASWLRKDCRAASWPQSCSNLVGTNRPDFLPLADYVSLALGMPTTGCFAVEFQSPSDKKASQKAKLVHSFSARRHVDDLIAGLLGGGTDPVLRRGQVACCTKCKRPLLNLACTGSEADGTAGVMKNGIANSCTESGRLTSEFGTVDRLIMPDAALLLELNCIATQTEGQFRIAECDSNRRNLRTVWFAFTADELKRWAVSNSVEWIEQRCQQALLDRFPRLMKKLEKRSVGRRPDVDYSAARAFRHVFGFGSPGCPGAPRRSIGWIRADAGDFSSWPPKVTPRGEFQEILRRHFWDAVRQVLPEQPVASAVLALVPDVSDRMIALRWLGQYPKDPKWRDRKARIPKPQDLLRATGLGLSSEVAALDEVVRLTSQTLLGWLIPTLESPWLKCDQVTQSFSEKLPWRDFDEVGDWWRWLSEPQRQERLELVAAISATAGRSTESFAAALESWDPPDRERFRSPEEAEKDDWNQDDWNQVACGLLYLSYHELREFLWHQMETYTPPENRNTTHSTPTKHEVQS